MEPLLRALAEEKYEHPTPIQAQTIIPAMAGRDVLGCAQTGTGKTAAFALPILHQLGQNFTRPQPNHPQVLVLAPTRELAIQIGESFATYGRHLKVTSALIYGGVGQDKQVRAVDRGVHVVIATPGRLLDLMQQKHLSLSKLQIFVLDEADRMMDMGFLPDLRRIIAALPKVRQSLFFSATMPDNILDLSARLLSNPVSIQVEPKKDTVELIDQQVVFVEQSQKKGLLTRILRSGEVGLAIAFTRTKRGANALAEHLNRGGIAALAIHGNKSQNARERALEAFRSEKIQVLVATDLAARGIDIEGVTHVFNFELPAEPESYVHRIGRTGRAGASGIAIAFCSSGERGDLKAIERLIGKKVPVAEYELPAPDPSSVIAPSRRPSGPRTRGTGAPARRDAAPSRPVSAARSQYQARIDKINREYSAGDSASREQPARNPSDQRNAGGGRPGGQRSRTEGTSADTRSPARRPASSSPDEGRRGPARQPAPPSGPRRDARSGSSEGSSGSRERRGNTERSGSQGSGEQRRNKPASRRRSD